MWREGGKSKHCAVPKHIPADEYDGFSSESEVSDDDFETESQGRLRFSFR